MCYASSIPTITSREIQHQPDRQAGFRRKEGDKELEFIAAADEGPDTVKTLQRGTTCSSKQLSVSILCSIATGDAVLASVHLNRV